MRHRYFFSMASRTGNEGRYPSVEDADLLPPNGERIELFGGTDQQFGSVRHVSTSLMPLVTRLKRGQLTGKKPSRTEPFWLAKA